MPLGNTKGSLIVLLSTTISGVTFRGSAVACEHPEAAVRLASKARLDGRFGAGMVLGDGESMPGLGESMPGLRDWALGLGDWALGPGDWASGLWAGDSMSKIGEGDCAPEFCVGDWVPAFGEGD